MPWWSNNFLSSSSSSGASSPRSPNTTDRHHPRRLTRLRKIRHLREWEIAAVLSKSVSCDNIQSSRSSLAVPQPLPEPEPANKEWASLLQRDRDGHENSKGKFPLPSPKEAASRGSNDRDKSDAVVGNGTASDGLSLKAGIESRSARQDAQKSSDSIGTQSNRKVPRDKKGVGSSRENFVLNVPVRSAPTSAYSSPIPSPQRMSTGDLFYHLYTPTQGLQVWSAPEMPTGFPSQMSPDAITFSPDSTPFYGSPLHSPRVKSPRRNNARSPTRSASPLHKIVSIDISPAARESNGNANVHPLPLPPGATMSSQPVPVPQVPAKTELLPMTSQWQKGKLIGRGTFGSVYMATNLQTGALCAMKEVLLCPDDPKSAECIKQLEQEIKVLSHLKHTNIVQYYGSEIVGDKFYIYLEYVYPGSINKYVNEHCGAITECVVRNFTRHILSGLAYLHSTKTIHRDIKGANLLVDSSGVVKLADFGMAKHLTGPVADLSLKGSPYWMAPELMQCVMQKDNSSDSALAVDIWSLGCTIIEMLNGKPPWSEYEGAAAMFKVMRETPSIPESLSPEGKDFLRCCFQRNPAERPSASKLLEHRFLKNSQQSDVSSCTQGFSALKLQDKVHSPRERSIRNFDNLATGAQTPRGKFTSDSETGQQSHHETNDLTVACHHSPRSTLETLPSLSPPHSGCSTHHPSPSGKGSNVTKHGSSRKNRVFLVMKAPPPLDKLFADK